jgi:hypothetical protein
MKTNKTTVGIRMVNTLKDNIISLQINSGTSSRFVAALSVEE